MIRAIRSEYRRFFSTRVWWILSLGMFALIFVSAGLISGLFTWTVGQFEGGGPVSDEQLRPMVYGLAASMGYVFPAIIGAFAWTNEYRHRTIIPTLVGEPRRMVVSLAKVVAGVPMGFVIGTIGTIGAIGGGAIGFVIFGEDPHLVDVQTWENFGLSVLALTLWALVGVGLGMLITNQVGAIVVLILWVQLIEPLVAVGLGLFESTRAIAAYLPGSLGGAISGGNIYSMFSFDTQGIAGESLPVWEAALVLAAYGVVFGVLGYFLRIRRDIK